MGIEDKSHLSQTDICEKTTNFKMAICLPSAKRIRLNEELANYYQDTTEGQEYARNTFGTDFGIILTPCVICGSMWIPMGFTRPHHLADSTKYSCCKSCLKFEYRAMKEGIRRDGDTYVKNGEVVDVEEEE